MKNIASINVLVSPLNNFKFQLEILMLDKYSLCFFYLSHLESWHYSYLERIFSIVFNLQEKIYSCGVLFDSSQLIHY